MKSKEKQNISRPEGPRDMATNAMLSHGWDPGRKKKVFSGKTSEIQINSGFIVMD